MRQTAPSHVAAFDLTFSAPKSVSVLFGLGDDSIQGMARGAHDHAVAEALRYLERNAAAVRRGHGGAVVLPGEGLVAAVFRHRTSRAGDPQLHSHVVVANIGFGADDRWTALDGRRLYRHAATASRIYQAVLRGELTRSLGVEWKPVRDGIAEIAGVPADIRRLFSRRRAEIEAALEERGVSGPRASELAALATRRAKRGHRRTPELRDDWRRRAADVCWHGADLADVIDRTRSPEPAASDIERLVADLLGPKGLTCRRSSFARHDVVAALCEGLPVGTSVDATRLEGLADRVLRSPAVVALVGEGGEAYVEKTWRRRDGRPVPVAQAERRYSTAELLATEQRVLDTAEHACRKLCVVPAAVVDQVLARRDALAAEQDAMVRRLTQGAEAVATVSGRAGTGKTLAFDAARAAWEAGGLTVVGAAVARRAARELELGAGIDSTSVHALLKRVESGRRSRR